jgi:hypothetical protein
MMIEFKFLDKFSLVKFKFYSVCCCRKDPADVLSKRQLLYHKGY